MKRYLPFLFTLLLFTGQFQSSFSQNEAVKRKPTLTHHMSAEEKALFYTVGADYEPTDPPPGEIHNIAEFEKMEGVLIGYPGYFGIPYTLIAALSEVVPVTTVVENNSQLNYVTGQYENNGVNMDNTNFLVTPLDSYWTRDYGPWFIRYGDDQIGIIDFVYNRPNRPNDNAIPPQMADYMDIEWFGMELITAGGNYMTDGYGISSSSELTWEENPDLTADEIDQMLLDYCGINTYHVLPDPNNTYIDHIDCWGKFLDVDKVLIREVPETHPQYDEIEETAAYFAEQLSAWGNNYQVYRVWTPNNEPYTNSLIVNDKVFLPIMGGQWDDEAVASYEAAMPGYEILTFVGSWESTDALHCRVKGLADRNMLYIEHFPLLGEQEILTEYEIDVEITAYSGESVINDEVRVIYWINGELQEEIVMTHDGGKLYSAVLPAGPEGSEMAYYITAQDEGGNTTTHPVVGEPDPHRFFVGEQLFAAISLDVSELNMNAPQGNAAMEAFNISNTGELELNYTIDFSTAVFEDYTFDIEDSPSPNAWNSNTFEELGWEEFEVTEATGEIANWSLTFDWDVDQYAFESTIYAESPAGTITVVAAGLPDGSYTIDLAAFNGEEMQGTWKIWLEDGYGDGGHQATNISLTITKTYVIQPWLTVEPVSGSIDPGEYEAISVTCEAADLPPGDYEGKIWVTSNDPDFPMVEIPVYFTVEVTSGSDETQWDAVLISNYPNPFSDQTLFEIRLPESEILTLTIYNGNGQVVLSLLSGRVNAGTTKVIWKGTDRAGQTVSKGIYYYQLKAGNENHSGKLIMK